MKVRVTKREIMNGYNNVICVGYCCLQNLLEYESPEYYTTRREGWGADIYDVGNGNAICTGYAPFGNIRVDSATCQKYEEMVHEHQNSFDYKKEKAYRTKKLNMFVSEVLKQKNEKK